VKTKIALELMAPGQILEVWLDDGDPIDNVPGSVSAEGHKILAKNRVEKYWSLVIEKK
jgi:sulfite reductase (ferredoxin)